MKKEIRKVNNEKTIDLYTGFTDCVLDAANRLRAEPEMVPILERIAQLMKRRAQELTSNMQPNDVLTLFVLIESIHREDLHRSVVETDPT